MTGRANLGSVLEVQGLTVSYGAGPRPLRAVRDVSFRIAPGESYGLIGESGSGKSTVAYTVMRYLPGGKATGRVVLAGQDVMTLPEAELAPIRGRTAAMVYQDPMSALNPAIRVGEQIAEAVRLHRGLSRRAARDHSVALLKRVHLPTPAAIARHYPHQLSGGQQQRVVIAMALACDPQLLILDEPTTGLDVTTEAVILDLVNELRHQTGVSVLFISHNMGVVAQVCDRVGVLYAGQLVEEGTTQQVLRAPLHPYTAGLMRAMPGLDGSRRPLVAIPGRLPDLRDPPMACVFADRCHAVTEFCASTMPGLSPATDKTDARAGTAHLSRCHFRDDPEALPLPIPPPALASEPPTGTRRPRLQAVALQKAFRSKSRLFSLRAGTAVRAVDDVTIEIMPGETLAVVGESGSGKSTLARCVAGLLKPDAGAVRLDDVVIADRVQARSRTQLQAIQFIFQNPDAALNPHWTVAQIVARPMLLYGLEQPGPGLRRRVVEQLESVQLGERHLSLYPREMSGGEKQRVCIARAFAGGPQLVICDEPTSALDISVQAAILNELMQLQARHGTAYLFITHDLGVVRQVAHQVAVMRQGQIVEAGDPTKVFGVPEHPYTRSLIAAIPTLEKRIPVARDRSDSVISTVPAGAG
jgi:peptide/nickel transport system ATP-binding protein